MDPTGLILPSVLLHTSDGRLSPHLGTGNFVDSHVILDIRIATIQKTLLTPTCDPIWGHSGLRVKVFEWIGDVYFGGVRIKLSAATYSTRTHPFDLDEHQQFSSV